MNSDIIVCQSMELNYGYHHHVIITQYMEDLMDSLYVIGIDINDF